MPIVKLIFPLNNWNINGLQKNTMIDSGPNLVNCGQHIKLGLTLSILN